MPAQMVSGLEMKVHGTTPELNIEEAARILGISPEKLRELVESGKLKIWYRAESEYHFSLAVIEQNREPLLKLLEESP